MLFLVLKTLHVLGSTVFFGTGLGSVWFRLHSVKSGQVGLVAWADAAVVRADFWFTVPAAVLMPASGLWLVELYRIPLTTPWVLAGLLGYAVAGLTWLPAAFLQVKMRRLSTKAAAEGAPLPDAWRRAHHVWLLLGVPSFAATLFVFWVMVAKTLPFA